MWKKLNIDKDKFMDVSMPFLQEMEKITYDMSNRRDTWFLTLNGFLIATSWLIVTSENTPINTKNFLIVSIIFFTIWWFLYFNLYWVQATKLHKTIDGILEFSELENEDEIQTTWNKLMEWLKINSKDKWFNRIASSFRNIWLVLFVVWLITFMYSFK